MAKGKGVFFGALPGPEQEQIAKKYKMSKEQQSAMKSRRFPVEVGAGKYNVATPNHPRMKGGKVGEAVSAASRQALRDGIADAVKRLQSGKYLDVPPALSTDETMLS